MVVCYYVILGCLWLLLRSNHDVLAILNSTASTCTSTSRLGLEEIHYKNAEYNCLQRMKFIIANNQVSLTIVIAQTPDAPSPSVPFLFHVKSQTTGHLNPSLVFIIAFLVFFIFPRQEPPDSLVQILRIRFTGGLWESVSDWGT